MAQRLIVEGDNDMHALTNICIKRGLKNPLGYEGGHKFNEFITMVRKEIGYADLKTY